MYRAGGMAAALALAVSGGAYAAVQAGDGGNRPLSESRAQLDALGGAVRPADVAPSEAVEVDAPVVSQTTVTEETTEDYSTVKKETTDLPAGQTKVDTPGQAGVTRTTYQVVMEDGVEVSREAISSVVVTEKVDEVVLVGVGSASSAPSVSAPAPFTSSSPSSEAAAPAAPAPAASGNGTTKESAKSIARSMLASYGWGDDQFSCLDNLWTRESQWNYQAKNPSSGAYGIPQALPGSKMGSVASDWATNPTTQITWGLGYIKGRYGTPCSAWAHSQSTGWY